MQQKNVCLFCSGIDDVLLGSPNVAGIQVQMSFWAKTFVERGWKVCSFSKNSTSTSSGIEFVRESSSRWLSKLHLRFIMEWCDCWKAVIGQKPDLVVNRGASRSLFLLECLCRIKKVKLIQFGASDTDFIPGQEILAGSSLNRKLYQKAIQRIGFFVSQNTTQHNALQEYYGKESIILPNIWIPTHLDKQHKYYDALWVANLRPLKRVEWFVNLAKSLPQYQFTIVGGVLFKEYYEQIEQMASGVSNLSFLGAKSFAEVNELLTKSRLLVCTSEFEGFPNTFLQAWAYDVPVVSTVNPNSCITDFGLGTVVEDETRLQAAVRELLSVDELYAQYQQNIKEYFTSHHDANTAYQKLMELIAE
ncbi:MAG: glycosyltransferase family 4 protein [Bacteroidales bacterium]|nr:glycosyltransferase family 4 protein [Bacteroidales bacterium]